MRHAIGAGMLMLAIAAPVSAETRKYDLAGFHRIEASKAFTIRFTQSPDWSVTVDSRNNNLDQIVVEKEGDTLRITRPEGFCMMILRDGRTTAAGDTSRSDCLNHDVDDVVTVSAPGLDALALDAAIKFTADRLKADSLDIRAHAAAVVEIGKLTAGAVDAHVDAASRLTLAGSCKTLDVELGAASKVEAANLKCTDASVDAGAASSAQVYASRKATARAGVAANVQVSGHPKDFQKSADRYASNASLVE